MINASLDRNSNPLKALFPNAVGEIKNMNVNGTRISFELFFYADEQARQLLNAQNPNEPYNHMNGQCMVKQQHFSEELSVIESYEPESADVPPTEQLKSCCYQWLKERHYPQS